MITPAYCVMMARYNAWQNRCMRAAMETLSPEALKQDRGAFFGSILGTANHLVWADLRWLSRLTDIDGPTCSNPDSPGMFQTLSAWAAERFRTDGKLLLWAENLRALDLLGELRWTSGAKGGEVSAPMGLVVTHIFNHQTHHRGQIHAMLTAAGAKTADTDLFLMPDEGPWL